MRILTDNELKIRELSRALKASKRTEEQLAADLDYLAMMVDVEMEDPNNE